MRRSGVGLHLFGEREYRDAGDVVERSGDGPLLVEDFLAREQLGDQGTDPDGRDLLDVLVPGGGQK